MDGALETNDETGDVSLGDLLVRFRSRAGLTQEGLAEVSGLGVRTIQAIESGSSRAPQPGTVRLLLTSLDLSRDERDQFIAAVHRKRQPVLPRRTGALPGLPGLAILGREAEIAEIERRLAGDQRLITLIGPGGVGKTTLARVIAARRTAASTAPVIMVRLESVTDPDSVLTEIAHACGVREIGDESIIDRIAGSLEEQGALLVLDNMEHLIAAAQVIIQLRAAAPFLHIIVTSREALRFGDEHCMLIDPLPVPRPGEDHAGLAANPAVALFMQALASASPSRVTGPAARGDLDGAADIVRLLDGLPLAIELAAAQGATLPLPTITTLLKEYGLTALSRGRRDIGARFATMEAAVNWSVDLLPPDARRLFRLLGAFPGGFTTEAIANVAAESGAPALIRWLPLVAESQLIQPDPAAPDHRFRMLEPVRMVALALLHDAGEAPGARRAHAAWFHRWAREQALLVAGPDPLPALDALNDDLPNIRAAIEASCDPAIGDPGDALVTVSTLSQYWEARGHLRDGRAAIAHAVAAAGPNAPATPALMDAVYWSGYLPYLQSSVEPIDEAIARLRPLAEADGSPEYATRVMLLEVLRADAAGAPLEEWLPRAREAHALIADQPREVSWYQSTVILANMLVHTGDYEEALPLLESYEEWAIARASDLHIQAAKGWLGFALIRLGRTVEARALFTESLLRIVEIGSIAIIQSPLLGLALTLTRGEVSRRDLERGAMLIGALDRLNAINPYPISGLDAVDLEDARARIAAAFGARRTNALLATGADLGSEGLLDLFNG